MTPIATIKTIAGVLVALLLFVGGRSCGVNSAAKDLAACNKAYAAAVYAGAQMADALEATTKATQSAVNEAAIRMKRADEAVQSAIADRSKYEGRLRDIAASMDAGMANPSCAAKLQEAVCVPLD